MEDSFQKNLVQESDYSKYLEQLKTYYNLKNRYTSRNQTFINKLINSNDSIETKKKLYSKNKMIVHFKDYCKQLVYMMKIRI